MRAMTNSNVNHWFWQLADLASSQSPEVSEITVTHLMSTQTYAFNRGWKSGFRAGFVCATGLLLAIAFTLLIIWGAR